MKFVVIGGDAAGMSAASRAKRRAPDMEVIVLEKTGDVSYSACGLPYNIADSGRPVDDLVVRHADQFREKQGILLYTGYEVRKIDREGKSVIGITGEGNVFSFEYDRLLIATGGFPVRPDIDGINLPGVFVLKNLEHGRKIKSFIEARKVARAVILGMGYIALEMCEALHDRGIHVTMVKPGTVFLPWMDRELAGVIAETLAENGIVMHQGRRILAIKEAVDGELTVACDGLDLPADMVLAAIGIRPVSDLAAEAGLELGPKGAVAVNHRLETSDPEIYSAGDCGDAYHVVTGEKVWIPLALRANRAGWAVADNVCGKGVELAGVVGTSVFKVFDLEVARTGLTADEAKKAGFDPAVVTISSRSRAHSHPGAQTIHVHMVGDKKSGRLLGVQMVGKEGVAHRINAPATALHAGMSVAGYAELDLAYAPPFSPVWDPTLVAANQLLKKLRS